MPEAVEIGRLHVITDTTIQSRYSHAELAELAIRGGADTIQYRSKGTDARLLVNEAGAVRDVCAAHGVLFLVNDRVDLCLAVNADGVHLGLKDLPLALAREILGSQKIIGGTVRNEQHLRDATAASVDYVGLGPIFTTTSKDISIPTLGLDLVRQVCQEATIPVIGIAGITAENAAEVIACGAFGIAVIGAVCRATDVRGAAAELRIAMNNEEGGVYTCLS